MIYLLNYIDIEHKSMNLASSMDVDIKTKQSLVTNMNFRDMGLKPFSVMWNKSCKLKVVPLFYVTPQVVVNHVIW